MAEDNQESTEFVREAKPGTAKISKKMMNAGAGIIAVVLIVVLFSALFSNDNGGGKSQETREARERLEEREAEARAAARAEAEARLERERELFNDPWIMYVTDSGSETTVYLAHEPGSDELGYTYSFTRSGATHVVEGECDKVGQSRFNCEWEQQTSQDQSSEGKLTLIRESDTLFSGYETYVGTDPEKTGVTPIYLAHSEEELEAVRK